MSQLRPTLLVPDAAVVTDQSVKLLFTVAADGTVVPKPVELGPVTDDNLRVIRTGITADDQVIISGLLRARPGQKVTPEQGTVGAPPAAPGAAPAAKSY
jgi:multidrug efflux pump subunit AcrA (membrane-fusion protein)